MTSGTFHGSSFYAAQIEGQQGMALSLERAERHQPDFASTAKAAILSHLEAVGQASGEDLVDVAIAHGAVPPDARAFGGIFQSLSRAKQIVCLRSDLPRKRGHGTSGGKLWGICQ